MKVGIVTLATTDDYAKGAVVLARSLKKQGSRAELVCMVSPDVSEGSKLSLQMAFDRIITIDVMNSNEVQTLNRMGRAELGVTWTKLNAWKLTEYAKMIFMDADMICVQNIDELFERDEISAVPDCGWPSIFNSGLFVFTPSIETYGKLVEFAKTNSSWDGGDQGLLNSYFSDWSTKDISRILPFGYNVHAAATYAFNPAHTQFKDSIKVIHFLGASKPWQSRVASPGPFNEYWHLWWNIYNSNQNGGASYNTQSGKFSESSYTPNKAFQPPPTKSAPAVGSIDDILSHIDNQIEK